jgi:hypothetical protein
MGDSEQVLNDSLHVKWVKAHAWKQHWEEEVLLIEEEMHRVVMFHEWKAQWWLSQAQRRTDGDLSITHGITAYAEKQAHLCKRLAQSCVTLWLPALKGSSVTSDWDTCYTSVLAIAGEIPTDGDSEMDEDGNGGVNEIDDSKDKKGECYKEDNVDINLFD